MKWNKTVKGLYKKYNPYNFPEVNKKVIGMMKDELS